jgi:predicted anti-sigma-YlaC factor YlaD
MTPRGRTLACREVVELVTDYLEDALEYVDRVAFEAHVARCRGCAAYLDQMRTTLKLVGASAELLPPVARPALLRAFRSWSRRRTVLPP